MSINYLANLNAHDKDSNITFINDGHIYTVCYDNKNDSSFLSVTTLIHKFINKFNTDIIINNIVNGKNFLIGPYAGMSKEQIKQKWSNDGIVSREKGTVLHYDIECKYNNIEVNNISLEYQYFLNFYNDNYNLKPYRTEWLIYSIKYKIAGSIDMTFMREDGIIDIYDWKRIIKIETTSKYNKWLIPTYLQHLPDTNYWHYALQLNIYKYILVNEYGINVDGLYLVCLHPNNNNYKKIKLPNLQNEVYDILKEREKLLFKN